MTLDRYQADVEVGFEQHTVTGDIFVSHVGPTIKKEQMLEVGECILAINGDKPRTARDAAAMIRDAQGCVRIRLLRKPPVFVTDSALKLQRRWRQRRGSLAYKRCRPGLLGWLERAQIRLGAYGPDGAARQRDLEEFEGDCALAAIHA